MRTSLTVSNRKNAFLGFSISLALRIQATRQSFLSPLVGPMVITDIGRHRQPSESLTSRHLNHPPDSLPSIGLPRAARQLQPPREARQGHKQTWVAGGGEASVSTLAIASTHAPLQHSHVSVQGVGESHIRRKCKYKVPRVSERST